jgi:hypothetical protein
MYKLYKYGDVVVGAYYMVGNVKKAFNFDLENVEYQEYLDWVAEGNTPEPADEVKK